MERKTEAPRRYFTAQERHGEALPEDRLIALELLEVDVEAGVARFSVEMTVSSEDGEAWFATLPGWEGRVDPAELADAAIGRPVLDELTIPLSDDPQLTQLEVRNFSTGAVGIYWVHTQGTDARTFRYLSFPDRAVGDSGFFGYLREVEVDDYEPTSEAAFATHAHALIENEVVVVPLAEATVRMRRVGEDTYVIYGGG